MHLNAKAWHFSKCETCNAIGAQLMAHDHVHSCSFLGCKVDKLASICLIHEQNKHESANKLTSVVYMESLENQPNTMSTCVLVVMYLITTHAHSIVFNMIFFCFFFSSHFIFFRSSAIPEHSCHPWKLLGASDSYVIHLYFLIYDNFSNVTLDNRAIMVVATINQATSAESDNLHDVQ